MAKQIRKLDMVTISDVANVMGVSAQTIRNNVYDGYLDDIRMIKTRNGLLFHIFDLFKYAHPNASKDTIERMIYDYRTAKLKKKRAARAKSKKLYEQKSRGVKVK